MKNQTFNSVKIATSRRSKSRFSLPHDVNTTFSWGDVQPLLCRPMYPGDKNVLDISSLVRLAPLVRPTFGRIKYKVWSQFVNNIDIMPEFGSLMADTPTLANGSIVTPKAEPSIPVPVLSAMCLIGAKATAYYLPNWQGDDTLARTWKVEHISASTPSAAGTLMDVITGSGYNASPSTLPHFDGFTGPSWTLSSLLNNLCRDKTSHLGLGDSLSSRYGAPINNTWLIPSGNKAANTFLLYTGHSSQFENYPLTNVAMDKADCVFNLCHTTSDGYFGAYLAFRFSAFGTRLFKIFTGLGWKLNFGEIEDISILPLLAFYKAYWDVFGLTRLRSWRETSAYKLIDLIRSRGLYGNAFYKAAFLPPAAGGDSDVRTTFMDFITDLGNCWVTDNVDFVSAHTVNINNPSVDGTFASEGPRWLDTTELVNAGMRAGSSAGGAEESSALPAAVTQSLGSQIYTYLSGLSVDALMRLYRWTNKMSVAGREIANILKAQGYGYFVYSCKSNFIGYSETMVQITDVTSTADTMRDGTGAILADYAGKGVQYDESKTLEFETDEFGYWITFAAIVPEAGYSQGFDSNLFAKEKYQKYNAEFDSLGWEARLKLEVVGENRWPTSVGRSSVFGFAPRYFGIKSIRNIANGEFSLGHKKDDLLPYELDKHIPLGEHYVGTTEDNSAYAEFEVIPLMTDIPFAGDEWRYVSRYPWLGYFERIFANSNYDDIQERLLAISEFNDSSDSLAFVIETDDNFLAHNVLNLQSWRNMLPIDESFGTGAGDEFNDGFDSSMSKA